MPTVAFKSSVRTTSDHCTLTLAIRHRLVIGQPSDIVHFMKLSLPDAVDVLLASQLLITISGMLNGARIPPAVLVDSCIAHRLLEYLRLNAHELGINAVSNTYISGDTGLLTFACTGARPFPTANDALRTTLVGFDLDYIWQIGNKAPAEKTGSQITAILNPFSRSVLSLPYLAAVNNVIERFVIFQLVKRYPLIFGPWCQQLDVETRFFMSISRSITRIKARSPNLEFQRMCNKLLKLCKKQSGSSSSLAAGTLSDYLGHIEVASAQVNISPHSQADCIATSMERLYRLGSRRPLFKGILAICIPEDMEDAILLDHDICGHTEIEVDSGSGSYQALESYSEEYNLDSEDEGVAFYPDSMDQLSETEQTWPCFDSVLAPLISFSPEKCLREDEFDDFSHLDATEEENGDVMFEFRDRLGSESPSSWYEYDGTSAELDLREANTFSTCRDWSGDDEDKDEGSQEKLNFASMGILLSPNVDDFQPHNLPGSRLARTNEFRLDPVCLVPSSHHGFRASPSNLPEDMNHDDGNLLFSDGDVDMEMLASGIDFDAKENWVNVDAPTAALHFDYDSGTDSTHLDHESTELENPPNAVALSLGSDSTVTVERYERVSTVISPEDDSSFGTQQQLLATDRTCKQEGSPKAPSDCGFLAIEFD